MRMLLPLFVVLAGCFFDPSGLPPTAAPPPDAAEPPDAEPPPDASEPDARKPDIDAAPGLDVGAACNDDKECATAACEDFGTVLGKRCAALCAAPTDRCPLGTQCKDGVCGPA